MNNSKASVKLTIPLLTLLSTKAAKCHQNYFKKDLKTKYVFWGGVYAGACGEFRRCWITESWSNI